MSFNENSTVYDPDSINVSSTPLIFKVTTNMKRANITKFILSGSDFEFTFTDDRKRSVSFSRKNGSVSHVIKKIGQKLSSELGKVDSIFFNLVLGDIENELITRRDEIFRLTNDKGKNSDRSNNNSNHVNHLVKKFFEDVNILRQRFNESGNPYAHWQSDVSDRYNKLRLVTIKHYAEAWSLLEFCLLVKSILNIEGITLPFMGVILAAPASMKTMIIQLFRKYPNSFYSDSKK